MSRKYLIASSFCLAGVMIDQVSKTLIKKYLEPIRYSSVFDGFLEFRYAENEGMAFGMFPNIHVDYRVFVFCGITLVAVLIIGRLLRQADHSSIQLPAALGLILSGAFGNLIDRFRWGYVVDFIRSRIWNDYWWPTFNLADTFITVGIVLLIFDTLFAREPGEDGEEEVLGSPETDGGDGPPLAETAPDPDESEPEVGSLGLEANDH